MLSCIRFCLVSVSFLVLAQSSQALQFTFNATDSGWHSNAGNHAAGNENYAAGWSSNETLRNFFVFDLSLLPTTETVLSVTLRAYNPAVNEPDVTYTGGYESGDATETYTVREVLLTAAVVTAPSVLTPAVYTALGLGTAFGSVAASAANNGTNIDVLLNAAGIASVETFAGLPSYVLGGTLDSLTSAFGENEFVFGHTDPLDLDPGSPYTRQLIVTTTPEPASGALLALGLVALGSARRSRAGARRIG